MPAYLLTWNPARFAWEDFPSTVSRVNRGETVSGNWAAGNTKKIQAGDRVYFLKQGRGARGIFGSGWATGRVQEGRLWDGRTGNTVTFDFDELLDWRNEPLLTVEELNDQGFARVNWRTPASGISVPDALLDGLEAYWQEFLSGRGTRVRPATVRNPPWTRDELILALDLYFREPSARGSKTHPGVIELSDTLNKLPIHPGIEAGSKFRNPSGVGMKLSNFLRYDPDYSGTGLNRGSKLEEDVWHEFATDKARLANVAAAIRANYELLGGRPDAASEADFEDEEAPEGRVLTRVHKVRERDRKLIQRKKEQAVGRYGRLVCEVCDFDFRATYGELGKGFAECHHERPVSELKPGDKTKLSELRIVCANCHRIIHRARPWRSVEELREIIESR